LYVYLQAYQNDPATPSSPAPPSAASSGVPLFAYVSLYSNQKIAMETPPIAVKAQLATRLGIVPLSFHVGLGTLDPGQYKCQVTVLDPAGRRAGFWQGPLLIVP
jgi:hypothetical protein